MKLIRLAMLTGVVVAIPLCVFIYLGVDQLEKTAKRVSGIRDELPKLATEHHNPLLDVFALINDQAIDTPEIHFPVRRTLTHVDGRTLDVALTGKSSESVAFLSFRDNHHYHFPVANLSEEDQSFLKSLPFATAEPFEYPIPRRLRNDQGQELDALIIGRSKFDVFFKTEEKPGISKYSIQKLSPQDRIFVFSLDINR